MPLYQQKKYILNPRPKDLKPEEEVFIVQQTKECFRDYKDYIAKVFTYSSQQWSCEVTGKDGLTYSEAVSSEREASKLHVHSSKENMKCITNAGKKGERSDKKNPLRSSLSTISGPNANKRTFGKVLSRTAVKDVTQRTLTCFVKNTGHSKQLICNSTPIKQVAKSGAKRKGSPEVEISLEPKLKSKSNSPSPKDTSAKEKTKKAKKLTTFQTHFDLDDTKSNSTKNVHSNEKELKIIKKNASKGQQTLSQMFKNSSSNDADIKKEVGKIRSKTVTYSNQRERAKNGNRKPLVTTFSKSHFATKVPVSPSLKPVNVPEELRKEYGDLLMITEFVYFYGKFLSQDRDIVLTPDQLVFGLMNEKSKIFEGLLSGFLRVLLEDLGQKKMVKEFADLGINLTDMPVSEKNVYELTRLYLKYRADNEELGGNFNDAGAGQSLRNLIDLCEDDLSLAIPATKLRILVYMCEEIITSELFYSHFQSLDADRRQTWVEKFQAYSEIRELVVEQKKLEDFERTQKEIDGFLDNFNENDRGVSKKESSSGDSAHKENVNNCSNKVKDSVGRKRLTKRQERAAKHKIDKEIHEEKRRVGELLNRKRLKAERCAETIKQVQYCRRLKPLGMDHKGSLYWLLHSNNKVLYVEKTVEGTQGNCANDDHPNTDFSNGSVWFFYDLTVQELKRLVNSLTSQNEDERALRLRLNSMEKHEMELFRNRKSERPVSFCEEVLFEPLLCLKEEMCDLASRLVKGAAASVCNLVDWSANVKMAKSSKDLMPLALELASSISCGNLWSELHDREKWLTEDWTRAVKEATSVPRLRYCVAILDYCIMWERCSVFLKCKVCRRKGGAMAVCGKCHSGYHVVCLRPSLEVIPGDDWLCPTCRPKERGSRRSTKTKTPDEPVDGGQEETVVDNHDFCDVCGGDGELVCCDNCPNVYHKECHDPPLRNIPRGFWKCRSCHGRRPAAIKYTPRVEEDEDDEFSDFESSDEETGDDDSYMKTESDGEKSGSEVDQAYGECDENGNKFICLEKTDRRRKNSISSDENPSSGKRRKKRK